MFLLKLKPIKVQKVHRFVIRLFLHELTYRTPPRFSGIRICWDCQAKNNVVKIIFWGLQFGISYNHTDSQPEDYRKESTVKRVAVRVGIRTVIWLVVECRVIIWFRTGLNLLLWSPTGIARGTLLYAQVGRHPGQTLAHSSTGKARGLLLPG
jgi:hypothetical protein